MVKLSIIIAYYKTYDLTKKLLNKLIPQLNDNVEVFLVDDGCNEERLDQFKDKINIEHLKENIGSTSAMNKQLKKATGQYIAIIDSDDMIADDYIETLLKTIDSVDKDVIFFDWQDMNTGEIVRYPHNYAAWKAIYKRSIMPNFRDGWRYSYDVPFQADLNKTNYTRHYIDKILYYYNSKREGSLTLIKERNRRANMIKCEVIDKFTLANFGELENIERKGADTYGKLYVGDKFDCNIQMADYLTGNNKYKKPFVKIIETKPVQEPKIEKKNQTKKTTKLDKSKQK